MRSLPYTDCDDLRAPDTIERQRRAEDRIADRLSESGSWLERNHCVRHFATEGGARDHFQNVHGSAA